jgi:hypothetical protein
VHGITLVCKGDYIMGLKITKEVSTKMYEGDTARLTVLTIDFTGLTPEDIMEVAAQAAVVKWQGNARRGKVIPATATYAVPKPGTRGTIQMTPESIIARYGSIDAAIAALKSAQVQK